MHLRLEVVSKHAPREDMHLPPAKWPPRLQGDVDSMIQLGEFLLELKKQEEAPHDDRSVVALLKLKFVFWATT